VELAGHALAGVAAAMVTNGEDSCTAQEGAALALGLVDAFLYQLAEEEGR
jgi:hypothetical protein